MKILEVENVSKYYGSGENLVRAVDRFNFSVEKGDFDQTMIVGAGVGRNV